MIIWTVNKHVSRKAKRQSFVDRKYQDCLIILSSNFSKSFFIMMKYNDFQKKMFLLLDFFTPSKEESEQTLEAIQTLINRGIKIVIINSGNRYIQSLKNRNITLDIIDVKYYFDAGCKGVQREIYARVCGKRRDD